MLYYIIIYLLFCFFIFCFYKFYNAILNTLVDEVGVKYTLPIFFFGNLSPISSSVISYQLKLVALSGRRTDLIYVVPSVKYLPHLFNINFNAVNFLTEYSRIAVIAVGGIITTYKRQPALTAA